MGIYIPNIDMPKSCRECPFDDGNWICKPLQKSEEFKCPLIKIDDELFQKMENAYVLQEVRYGHGTTN